MLRRYELTDFPFYYALFSHVDVCRLAGIRHRDDITHHTASLYDILESYQSPYALRWCITLNKQPVGDIGVDCMNKRNGSAALAFSLYPTAWGLGIMKHAIYLVCRYLIEDCHFQVIEVRHFFHNMHCCHLMEKCNFQHIRRLYQAHIFEENSYDVDVWQLTVNQWKQASKSLTYSLFPAHVKKQQTSK